MAFSTTCKLLVALLLLAQTQSSSAFTSPSQSSSSATPDESEWETIMNADADADADADSYYKGKPSFLRSSLKLDLPTSKHEDAPTSSLQSQRQRQLNPNTGTFNVLVILVQFTDHQDRNLPPVEHFQELCGGTGPSTVNPAGSIAEYFAQQSYGKYNINCDVRDWRLTDNTEDFYAMGQRGIIGTLEGQEFFKPVLDEIEAEEIAKDQFFFIEFGDDNSSLNLIVLHSGYASEASTTDCYGRDQQDRIWSQGHPGLDSGGWETTDGNVKVQGYTVASALDSNDNCSGEVGAKMGKSNRIVVSVLCTVTIAVGYGRQPLAAAFD
jgi:hypothetical protein